MTPVTSKTKIAASKFMDNWPKSFRKCMKITDGLSDFNVIGIQDGHFKSKRYLFVTSEEAAFQVSS